MWGSKFGLLGWSSVLIQRRVAVGLRQSRSTRRAWSPRPGTANRAHEARSASDLTKRKSDTMPLNVGIMNMIVPNKNTKHFINYMIFEVIARE